VIMEFAVAAAGRPGNLHGAEIAAAMLAAKGVTDATRKRRLEIEVGVRRSLGNYVSVRLWSGSGAGRERLAESVALGLSLWDY